MGVFTNREDKNCILACLFYKFDHTNRTMPDRIKTPSLLQSFIPIFFLITLLGLNVYFFGDNTLSGANQLALILAATVGGIIAIYLGYS